MVPSHHSLMDMASTKMAIFRYIPLMWLTIIGNEEYKSELENMEWPPQSQDLNSIEHL